MSDSFPAFLFIETGDDHLPLAICWSLPDGQIKHTLIQPLESWGGDHTELGDYDIDTLHASGERPLDVLRELEADHSGDTVYINGLNDDEEALERLFDEYGIAPFIALEPLSSLYPDCDQEEWSERRGELLQEQGLTPMQADHEMLVMLMLHRRLNGEEGDEYGVGGDYNVDY
ncbi:hypothetical protein [Zymobacter palmae]|uniref:Uncharacterized protein n=1 Tax=Zymobacter palmae TaxID=33074 RepID=A0A348HEH3_9GAMM|nr:hypothetical protein [Zymobacter palmae]BBG30025.1 hypothetical protein ZBT109_1265 [Zymobacter palmae]